MTDQPISKRRSKRANVMLVASLDLPDRSQPVKLRNLSEDGALVEGAGTVPPDCDVIFRRNELQVPGRVVWVREAFAGIQFSQKLDQKAVLRHMPSAPQRTAPAELFKRPGLVRHQMTAAEQKWLDDWMSSSRADKLGE